AYNAAVKAGDYKAAAVEAKGIWPTFDKTAQNTAEVAREFGFASYVAGDYAQAREFGQFLKDKGASLPKPDDEPASSGVLLAAADYKLDAKPAAREALFAALTARAAQPGTDNITLMAAESLYLGDWAAANFLKVEKSAPL